MSKSIAQNAARDAGIGAVLGLMLVSGLVTSSLDVRQLLSDGREPLTSLGVIICVVVTQSALAAVFCGVFLRKFFSESGDDVEAQRRERLNRAQYHRAQFQVVANGPRLALARVEAPPQRLTRSAPTRA